MTSDKYYTYIVTKKLIRLKLSSHWTFCSAAMQKVSFDFLRCSLTLRFYLDLNSVKEQLFGMFAVAFYSVVAVGLQCRAVPIGLFGGNVKLFEIKFKYFSGKLLLSNYVTSEGAVFHIVLCYQNLSKILLLSYAFNKRPQPKSFIIWVRNYLFLKTYITSQRAVSHNQQTSIADSTIVSFYAMLTIILSNYQKCPVPLNWVNLAVYTKTKQCPPYLKKASNSCSGKTISDLC